MPHLVIERLRSVPAFFPSCSWVRPSGLPCSKRKDAACSCVVEIVDILAGLIFLVGSVCFLPVYSHELDVFLAGCALYVVGAVIYMILSTFTLVEAIREEGSYYTLEAYENSLYFLGSLIFLIGTILYWPSEAHYKSVEYMKELSLGAYFNWFSPEFEGTLLFIIGSVIFAFAAFVNGLNQRPHDSLSSRMLVATTSLYMGGSLLFVMGSVAFLPELGCNEQMVTIGAWCYIVGSLFYIIGGGVSFARTIRELRNPQNAPLLAENGGADEEAPKGAK